MKKRKMDLIGVTIADRNNPGTTLNRIVLNAAEIGVGAEIICRSKRFRCKINSRSSSTVGGIVSTRPAYESNECDSIRDRGRMRPSNITLAVGGSSNLLGGGFIGTAGADI